MLTMRQQIGALPTAGGEGSMLMATGAPIQSGGRRAFRGPASSGRRSRLRSNWLTLARCGGGLGLRVSELIPYSGGPGFHR